MIKCERCERDLTTDDKMVGVVVCQFCLGYEEGIKEGCEQALKEVLFLLTPNPKRGITGKQYSEWIYKKVQELKGVGLEDE